MKPEDIEEEAIKDAEVIDENANVKELLDEDVEQNDVEENTDINTDDFEVDNFHEAKNNGKDKKDNTKTAGNPSPNPNPEPVRDERKNAAVARLMKPKVIIGVYNSVAGRIGKMVNKTNPDCLRFENEDVDDLGILMEETVKEENWSGVPTKWLLLIVVAVILVGKIMMWSKPKEIKNAGIINPGNNNNATPPGIEKMMESMNKNIQELQEQNKLLRSLLDKKVSTDKVPDKKPQRFFKNYDLNKISFTKNGAIIDPSKAGKKGYTDAGAKMGIPSYEEKEVYEYWKIYRQHTQEHFSEEVA